MAAYKHSWRYSPGAEHRACECGAEQTLQAQQATCGLRHWGPMSESRRAVRDQIDAQLERYGLNHNARQHEPLHELMPDGYWTPWHTASAKIARLTAESVSLREQIAALESREVCTVAHDNVETCGYCQRDALLSRAKGAM